MEIKLNKYLLITVVVFLTTSTGCTGQEYTKKELDGLYLKRYQLYDRISPSDVKLNGLFAINEHEKIVENREVMFGKADNYEQYGPFPDEGIETINYGYTYGCFNFDDCKKKYNNEIPYNAIIFSHYPNEKTKLFSYLSFEKNQYKTKSFFLHLKQKKITVGNNIEDIKKLFPNSYKYYKLLSKNGYSVGFQVMCFSENKKIYFGLDDNEIIKNIEIEEIE